MELKSHTTTTTKRIKVPGSFAIKYTKQKKTSWIYDNLCMKCRMANSLENFSDTRNTRQNKQTRRQVQEALTEETSKFTLPPSFFSPAFQQNLSWTTREGQTGLPGVLFQSSSPGEKKTISFLKIKHFKWLLQVLPCWECSTLQCPICMKKMYFGSYMKVTKVLQDLFTQAWKVWLLLSNYSSMVWCPQHHISCI